MFRLRHRACARLVDYGLYGEMKRFEAWRGEGEAIARARAFLDRTPVEDVEDVEDVGNVAPVHDIGACGLMAIARDEVRAIGELFEETAPGPRAIAMWGPPGIGLRAAMHDLARAARMHGFVPLMTSPSTSLSTLAAGLDDRLADLLHGRSLLLLCPGALVTSPSDGCSFSNGRSEVRART